MTPSCAAKVVPAASATDLGTWRASRSPSAPARATIPAVAATDSWKPIDQINHGSRISSSSTAAARIEPVLLGRPASTPNSVSAAMMPARSTDGSAPVRTTKKTTDPNPTANRPRRPRRRAAASASIGASAIATFSPLTTSRCPRPVAWKSRATPGSIWEASPIARPRRRPACFGGKSRSMERPTNARKTCVARRKGFDAPPSFSKRPTWISAAMPLWWRASANASSVG